VNQAENSKRFKVKFLREYAKLQADILSNERDNDINRAPLYDTAMKRRKQFS
jgi:hypothetical protein